MARYKDVEGYRKLFDEEYKKTRKLISEGETHLDNLAEGFSEASRVIDCLPTADVAPKSEVAALKIEHEAMRTAANAYKMHYEKAKSEVERLHGILLQFTDIVHKWGAKNNIDTSEISLVPILQEEADSIIKKANQGDAREIFAEIGKILYKHTNIAIKEKSVTCELAIDYIGEDIAELKKKYTEEG